MILAVDTETTGTDFLKVARGVEREVETLGVNIKFSEAVAYAATQKFFGQQGSKPYPFIFVQ